MPVTGDSAFIPLALMEETPGNFQDRKTHEINEGSYECVYMYMYISLYLHIYILKIAWDRELYNPKEETVK